MGGLLVRYQAYYYDWASGFYIGAAFYAADDAPWHELIAAAEAQAPANTDQDGRTRLDHILPPAGSGREAWREW